MPKKLNKKRLHKKSKVTTAHTLHHSKSHTVPHGNAVTNTYIAMSLLVGAALIVYIIYCIFSGKGVMNVNKHEVELSIVKQNESVAPDLSYKLTLNPKKNQVSYVRVVINFDPAALHLTADPQINTEHLPKVISVTPYSEANTDGEIEIVLAEDILGGAPADTFDLATLSFSQLSQEKTEITFIDEEVQVVDSKANALSFSTNFAEVENSY